MTIIETEHETTVQPELDITEGQWRMDPSLKQRWVTALRSGKYEQGRQEFVTPSGQYCVLGVLCDVAGVPLMGGGTWNYAFVRSAIPGVPPMTFWEKNDHGWTFNQLADYIEENY